MLSSHLSGVASKFFSVTFVQLARVQPVGAALQCAGPKRMLQRRTSVCHARDDSTGGKPEFFASDRRRRARRNNRHYQERHPRCEDHPTSGGPHERYRLVICVRTTTEEHAVKTSAR